MSGPFIFDFPLFTLTGKELPGNMLSVLRISGEPSIALFTDSDLAERFASKFGLCILMIKNADELVSSLEDCKGQATHVIFDPENKQRRPTILPIDSAIEQFKRNRNNIP